MSAAPQPPAPSETVALPCLTLWQPWALLVVLGIKKIETRNWRPPSKLIGKTIGIHAAKVWRPEQKKLMELEPFRRVEAYAMEFGALIGTVRLTGFRTTEDALKRGVSYEERSLGDYSALRFAWLLEAAQQFDAPIFAGGLQGIFRLDVPAALLP